MAGKPVLPRRLWLYWHQGWQKAPWVVRRCLDSWIRENPTWAIQALDASTAREAVGLPERLWEEANLPLCALSDMIRVSLLADHGGVWADATVFCQRALDEWIHRAARTGFFAFDSPGPGRPLATWLIASAPRHYLSEQWRSSVLRLWLEDGYLEESRALWADWSPLSRPEDYFWCHGLFGAMIQQDRTASRSWGEVEKISAEGPHFVQFRGMLEPMGPEVKAHIDRQAAAVHKLRWDVDCHSAAPDSSLRYLLAE